MIQLDTGNIDIASINYKDAETIVSKLLDKREKLGFIDVDETIDEGEILKYAQDIGDNITNIVVLGIGGSALGTKAILECIHGKYYNEKTSKKGKNIYVLDNIDTENIEDILQVIDISETLFIFISKSGTTIETLSEYIYFRDMCKSQNPQWKKQFCFIIGENCSMRQSLEEEFQCFYIPENIGGRFSVFTAVGLLPLAFADIDISSLLEGVKEYKSSLTSTDIDNNIAVKLAYIQHYFYSQKNKNITVFFPYSSRMFMVGEWYKQLMGESIGKNEQGITLTGSLGVTDQHSQLQLFQDGPKDKFFLTLDIQKTNNDIHIYEDLTFKKLLDIEQYGTETSLKNEGYPLCKVSLQQLGEREIGGLLYVFMFQIAYLGELFDINAFDQPGVEKSKRITKQKLSEEFGDLDLFSQAFYG